MTKLLFIMMKLHQSSLNWIINKFINYEIILLRGKKGWQNYQLHLSEVYRAPRNPQSLRIRSIHLRTMFWMGIQLIASFGWSHLTHLSLKSSGWNIDFWGHEICKSTFCPPPSLIGEHQPGESHGPARRKEAATKNVDGGEHRKEVEKKATQRITMTKTM